MRKAIVLHADILGFKSIIEQSENEKEEETLNKLKESLNEAVKLFNEFKRIETNTSDIEYRHKLFSDNLYASFSYDESSEASFGSALILCVVFARSYYSVMLDNQLPIRGAISFGSDYSDDTMIFSHALVKAYKLESEAIYPRIVVDNSLMLKIKAGLKVSGSWTMNVLNSSFIKDKEGIWFLNPTGVAKDFDVSEQGFSSEELYKGFIKRDMDFCIKVVADIEREIKQGNLFEKVIEEKQKVIEKYKWLVIILGWHYYDRRKILKENSFTPLVFTRD